MNRNLLVSIAFIAGVATGIAATVTYAKYKNAKIDQEEEMEYEEAVIEEIFDDVEEPNEPEPEEEFVEEFRPATPEEVKAYERATRHYRELAEVDEKTLEEKVREKSINIVRDCNRITSEGGNKVLADKPYIIKPNEFGEQDYDEVTLVYYANGKFTSYDTGDLMDEFEIEDAIGDIDPSVHFGDYEEDSVFIRNDERGIDYEVLRDEDPYEE
jgi:hypothetical protein